MWKKHDFCVQTTRSRNLGSWWIIHIYANVHHRLQQKNTLCQFLPWFSPLPLPHVADGFGKQHGFTQTQLIQLLLWKAEVIQVMFNKGKGWKHVINDTVLVIYVHMNLWVEKIDESCCFSFKHISNDLKYVSGWCHKKKLNVEIYKMISNMSNGYHAMHIYIYMCIYICIYIWAYIYICMALNMYQLLLYTVHICNICWWFSSRVWLPAGT